MPAPSENEQERKLPQFKLDQSYSVAQQLRLDRIQSYEGDQEIGIPLQYFYFKIPKICKGEIDIEVPTLNDLRQMLFQRNFATPAGPIRIEFNETPDTPVFPVYLPLLLDGPRTGKLPKINISLQYQDKTYQAICGVYRSLEEEHDHIGLAPDFWVDIQTGKQYEELLLPAEENILRATTVMFSLGKPRLCFPHPDFIGPDDIPGL